MSHLVNLLEAIDQSCINIYSGGEDREVKYHNLINRF
jgi:hypothetical protein